MMITSKTDWQNYKPHSGIFRHKEKNIGTVEEPYFVFEDEIPELINNRENIKIINMYIRSKRWGLPFMGGWANQPAWIMDIFDSLDDIEAKYGQRTT